MRKSLVFAIIMVICSVTSCLHKVSENNDCVSNTFQNPILSSGHNPQAIFIKENITIRMKRTIGYCYGKPMI